MFGERLWLITMRSDLIKKGPSRAPYRSLLRALGIDELEMKRPFVAVVNSKSDYIPGHMHLDKIAEQVKAGIRNAGGVPFEFNTIGVCDGIAMNHRGMKYSLCSRELIADSIEVMLTAHPLDAIVLFPTAIKLCRVCSLPLADLICLVFLSTADLCSPVKVPRQLTLSGSANSLSM